MLAELTDDTVDALLAEVGPGTATSLLFAELRHLGGAVGRPAADAGALSHVSGEYAVFCVAIAPVPEAAVAGLADARKVVMALQPWTTGTRLLNFSDARCDTSTAFSVRRVGAAAPGPCRGRPRRRVPGQPLGLTQFVGRVAPAELARPGRIETTGSGLDTPNEGPKVLHVTPLRIAMWSGPRNLSTALMRSFGNRPDCTVVDEPLYAAYLAATGLDHPGRDEVIASQPTDWRVVCAGADDRAGGDAGAVPEAHDPPPAAGHRPRPPAPGCTTRSWCATRSGC